MHEEIFVVTVPQLGVNEELATVVEWYVPDGGSVSVGNLICVIETTKAVFDVEAEAAGFIVHLIEAGGEVEISQSIALIGSTLKSLQARKAQYVNQVRTEGTTQELALGTIKATNKAKNLAKRLGVNLTKISINGIIQEQDIIRHYENTSSIHKISNEELSWNRSRQPLAIYGAGKGAVTIKECLDFQKKYQIVCFVDDNPEHPNELLQCPIYHSSRLSEIVKYGIRNLAIAIANGTVRMRIFKQCDDLGINLINVIHPQAFISPTVQMGKGNYIKARAIIETNTIIGNCCIIDNGVVIAHDNWIGDGCHIAPGVAIGSSVNVRKMTIVGIGASIATGVRIGRSAIISVGSSVIKDVPDYAVIEGTPGKIVGKRKRSRKK